MNTKVSRGSQHIENQNLIQDVHRISHINLGNNTKDFKNTCIDINMITLKQQKC